MSILFIMILWTWCLTPLWVNIVGTILLSLKFAISIAKDIREIDNDYKNKEM